MGRASLSNHGKSSASSPCAHSLVVVLPVDPGMGHGFVALGYCRAIANPRRGNVGESIRTLICYIMCIVNGEGKQLDTKYRIEIESLDLVFGSKNNTMCICL